MNSLFTFDKKFVKKVIIMLSFLIPAVIITACSTSNKVSNTDLPQNHQVELNKNEKALTFHYKSDSKKENLLKVIFDDGKISRIYKNGESVPTSKNKEYSKIIYNKLNDMSTDLVQNDSTLSHQFHNKSFSYEINIDSLMPDNYLADLNFNFNNEKFKEEMKEVEKKLSKLKNLKIKVNFDKDKFKKQMDELKENMDMNDFEININTDKLKKEMSRAAEEMKNIKINIPEIKVDLSNLKEKLKDLNKKLKPLKGFMKELRKGLVEDGYLKNQHEDFDMRLNSDGMTINGKKVPDSIFKKYKRIYEKHFNKTLNEHGITIH